MRKSLGTWPLVATIFFCVSGGPFGLEPVMQSGAGIGLLLILVTPFVWALPTALMTAELASALPHEGGYYVWAREGLGRFPAFLCAWWTWVYSWVDVAIYPTLFAAYVHAMIVQLGGHSPIASNPWIKWGVGLVMIVPFTWLNVVGTKRVGTASVAFMGLLLVPFAVLVVRGLGFAATHFPASLTPTGQTPVAAAGAGMFVVMWNYLGWDSMSTVAAEVERPQRSFPRALAVGVPLVTLTYLLPAFVGITYLPDLRQWTEGAWTTVASKVGGPGLVVAMTGAGIVGACGLFSATLLAASRIPFVLADEGYLSPKLARLHPRFGTPVAAILLSALFYTVLSFQSFRSLAALDVVLYSAGLLVEFAALLALRVRAPDLPRPFRIPGGWPVLVLLALLPLVFIVFGVVMEFRDPDEGGVKFLLLSVLGLGSGLVAYPIAAAYRARV